MKEIKAYVRQSKAVHVVEKLQQAGATGMTIVNVHPIGYGTDPNTLAFSGDVYELYVDIMVKLELICSDRDVDRLVGAVREAASTATRGDGMIFVTDVIGAVRIRDGAEGEPVL